MRMKLSNSEFLVAGKRPHPYVAKLINGKSLLQNDISVL